jgi:hypothetical protein
MKLININKNGTQKFQLKDGRVIYSYTSGYVRIDSGLDRLYQINRVVKVPPKTDGNYFEMYKRILILCPSERFQYIKDWVKRNTFYGTNGVVLPYSTVRTLRQKTNQLQYLRNKYGYQY